MSSPASKSESLNLYRVVMRAISIGMGTFASLLVAAEAQAAGQLADLTLRPNQGRLQLELTWQGGEPPPVTTSQSDQGVILEFAQAELSQSIATLPMDSFPELGIQGIELIQLPDGVRMGITVMPGTPQGDLTIQQFPPVDHSQRFEVWITGISPESTAQPTVTVPPLPASPQSAMAEEAQRLEDLLSQVRQEALGQAAVTAPATPADPLPPPSQELPDLTRTPVPAPQVASAVTDTAPQGSDAAIATAISAPPPQTAAVSSAGPSPSMEDLLTQVREKAWARQGVSPVAPAAAPAPPPAAQPLPTAAQPSPPDTPAPPAPPPVAQVDPQSTPAPLAEEITPDSTSSVDLNTDVAPPSPPQPAPQLPALTRPESITPIAPSRNSAAASEALILAPSLARQQNVPPPLIEPEPFLSRLEDSDIAAPLTRHSLIPFPGEDSVLLAAQPSPGLSDTRVQLLQDSSISTAASPPLPLGSEFFNSEPIQQINPLAPEAGSAPLIPTPSGSGSPSQTLLPNPAGAASFEFSLPSSTPDPTVPPLPPLPGIPDSSSSAAPSSSIAANDAAIPSLPILTPSLEQNQPLEVPDPSFQTPGIQDLPSATQTQPNLSDPLLQPQPFMGQLSDAEVLSPLQRNSLALVPILAQADPPGSPTPFQVAILPEQEFQRTLSPLERPPQRLFGFETGTILRHGEMILQAGGVSFQNPNDFRTVLFNESNRSNDLNLGFDLGLWDTLQLSIGAEGKDDTIFANVIAPNAGVSVIFQGVPVQLKWQAIETPRWQGALVGSAQFAANTVPGRVDNQEFSDNPSSRKILITTDASVDNVLLAEDSSTYFSIATPITYQLDRQTRITLNPQASFFPETIPVTALQGNAVELQQANIGFDGERLDYLGTIVGLGLGLDYDLSRHIKFVADYTAIISGDNTIEQTSDNSIFSSRSVWNAGFKFAPNSRLGIDLYATNRFSPLTYSPANILAQPGGDAGVAVGFSYLPDLGTTDYQIYTRGAYPEASAFLSSATNFSASVLPIGSAVYEIASGGSSRFGQTARFGLLDDLELVLSQSSFSRPNERGLSIEGGLLGRLAVFPDRGQAGLAAALGAGLLAYQGNDEATTVALYGDFPIKYRNRNPRTVEWSLTPKLVIPTQASGDANITAFSLGANLPLSDRTQIWGEYTPILEGSNQLVDRRQPGQGSGIFLNQRSSLFSLGMRQMFPTDNSLYALDVYWSNAAGTTGLQGLAALPDGGSQIGFRFTTLNGIPDLNPVAQIQ